MVCRACGGASFDAQGICLTCGVAPALRDDTAPRSAVRVGARLTIPEPTPAPSLRGARPGRSDDPASTNPGSGIFCGRCGSAVDVRNDYCGICGNPLNDAALEQMRRARQRSRGLAPPDQPNSPPKRQSPLIAQHTNPTASHPSPAPFPLMRIIILLLVVGLLVAAVLGVSLLAHQR